MIIIITHGCCFITFRILMVAILNRLILIEGYRSQNTIRNQVQLMRSCFDLKRQLELSWYVLHHILYTIVILFSICYHLIAVTTKWNNRWTKIRGWDSVLTIKKTATSLPIMSKHIRWSMCIYITMDIIGWAYNGWHSHSLCIRTSPLWYFESISNLVAYIARNLVCACVYLTIQS